MDIAKGLVIAGTGHRPDKLGGYDQALFDRLVDLATAALKFYGPKKIISGMALGWDQALATAALHLRIPYIAAVPFVGQEKQWPDEAQKVYKDLCYYAEETIHVSPPPFSPAKMQKRNIWMVEHCDAILALWNGSGGGTANCIQYAKSQNKPVINLWPSWARYR